MKVRGVRGAFKGKMEARADQASYVDGSCSRRRCSGWDL